MRKMLHLWSALHADDLFCRHARFDAAIPSIARTIRQAPTMRRSKVGLCLVCVMKMQVSKLLVVCAACVSSDQKTRSIDISDHCPARCLSPSLLFPNRSTKYCIATELHSAKKQSARIGCRALVCELRCRLIPDGINRHTISVSIRDAAALPVTAWR